jgi:hypothetical protein
MILSVYLEIGSKVLGDERRIALTEDLDLLLDILDLIFGLFQVDDLDGDHLLGPVVDPFVDFAERALPDTLLLSEHKLRIHPLERKQKQKQLSSLKDI